MTDDIISTPDGATPDRECPKEASGLDYQVGYGKPPLHTRFGKGQSGNPRGRPRGARNTRTILEEALNKKVTVNDAGRRRTMSRKQVLIYQLLNKAAAGDMRAMSTVLAFMENLDNAADASLAEAQLRPDDRVLMDRALKRMGYVKLEGQFCRIEPIDPQRHAADLCAAFSTDREHRNWTYLPYGPLQSEAKVRAWMTEVCMGADPQFHAILDAGTGKAVGVASYLRIDPAHGVIEVGHINYSPLLQRKAAATEAMFLMMRRVFDELGYRRYEWKCDALNAPSRKAALRFGFRYDGLFPQATMYKGRNRDTAWYSKEHRDWPSVVAWRSKRSAFSWDFARL